jgi:hypothetical protein
MDYEKQVELAKKLNALAKSGVGGEKTNAAAMLDRLIKKYGIDFNEIDSDQRFEREFKFQSKTKKLFVQICFKVIGKSVEFYKWQGRKGNYYVIKCNEFEYIQIKEYYSFYSKLLKQEIERFEKAFIIKNNLLPDDAESYDTSKMSREELFELKQILQIMSGIEAKSPHRILSESKL